MSLQIPYKSLAYSCWYSLRYRINCTSVAYFSMILLSSFKLW